MKKAEAKKIVDKSMKDMELSDAKRKKRKPAQAASDALEEQVPTLEELKKKYVTKSTAANAADSNTAVNTTEDDIDVKLVKNKKKNVADDVNELDEERTIIVSHNKGLLGSQG